jgi:hypothetical protein
MMQAVFNLSGLPADTRKQILRSPKWRALFARKPDKLLSVGADAKTSKGVKLGFRTAILYLSPAESSGVNLCPMAKLAQCDVACLFSAGRGAMQGVSMARLRKTLFYLQYPAEFKAMLELELAKLNAKAKRDGVTLLVRLNGTSDIRWEQSAPELFAMFPDLQFYDYTKIPNRRGLPANYDLTYSYSGVPAFQAQVSKARAKLMRIAVVFRHREDIPESFQGMQTVDGDDTDVRHLDPQGVVVALYAKGKAKLDQTGFVVDAS